MKTFKEIREEIRKLSEGKISMATLKKGDKVQMRFKGRGAKNQGFKNGDNPYGEGNKFKFLDLVLSKEARKLQQKTRFLIVSQILKRNGKKSLKLIFATILLKKKQRIGKEIFLVILPLKN